MESKIRFGYNINIVIIMDHTEQPRPSYGKILAFGTFFANPQIMSHFGSETLNKLHLSTPADLDLSTSHIKDSKLEKEELPATLLKTLTDQYLSSVQSINKIQTKK